MKTKKLTFNITRFHTIEEANIEINGITILTGCHKTGKDRLVSFIYDIVRYPLLYKKYRTDQFWLKLEEFYDHMTFLCEVINPFCDKQKYLLPFTEMNTFESENKWIQTINQIEKLYYQTYQNLPDSFQENRLNMHTKYREIYPNDYSKDQFMHLIELEGDPETFPVQNMFEPARQFIRSHFRSTKDFINVRPTEGMIKFLTERLSPVELPEFFQLSENDDPIFLNDRAAFREFTDLKQVLYIDEPRFFGSSESWYLRTWDYIYQTFLEANKNIITEKCEILKRIYKLIDGEVVQHLPEQIYDKYEPFIKKMDFSLYPEHWFVYKRNDGKTMPVVECSFDLKTFILLERLLVNRIINEQTLLIFNNPEDHLSPYQIKEFAWIITKLHARYGVRFLFSSYNPELVKAFQNTCKESNILQQLKIYDAKPGETPYSYSFS